MGRVGRGSAARTDDPRYARTREQVRRAVLDLLSDGAEVVTFARVADRAGVNRSTVHQHYGTRQELVADAYASAIARVTDPLARCPFDTRDGAPPRELHDMFSRAGELEIDRLPVAERALVAQNLADQLALELVERFSAGARPPGFEAVPPRMHAEYVAGGLARLLLGEATVAAAAEGWALMAPRR